MKLAPFSPNAKAYFERSATSWLNVAEGGKRAGKNVINLQAWASVLDTHPDKLHLAAGVTIAQAKMNILDSNGFGLREIFKGRGREMKYMGKEAFCLIDRQGVKKVILFAGGANSASAALIKGNTFGTAYITEVNECHQGFVNEVLDRTISSGRRQLFMDLNPKAPRHWFYRDFLDYQDELKKKGENEGYNYGHFTVLDNYSLSNEKLREVLSKYRRGSPQYRLDILGERLSSAGRIYTAYDYATVALTRQEILSKKYFELSVGVDVGGTDATCATLVGLTSDMRDIVVIDGMYHRQGMDNRMSESDYVQMVVDFVRPYMKLLPFPITIWVDSANKLFFQGMRQAVVRENLTRLNVKQFNKKDGILERINLNQALLEQGRFHMLETLDKWHEAYEMAVWDGRAYEKGEWCRLDDGSYPVDCLDSTEYAFYSQKRRIELA
ncbi:MAG: PBSX family phage terminase large subunit [Clostridia bacterium]|nr:PBSX family phage terminase large subunit [Clostridia bacterium]MBR1684049.1 PBSX family phage terminase large subunit [Clostridia bacterium]